MKYNTAAKLELALVEHFGLSKYIIVPNVYTSFFNYELDLCLINRKSFYATEVEIKISRPDLKRDQSKWHGHRSPKIRYLYFAMPYSMKEYVDLVPDRAGILLVGDQGKVEMIKRPETNKIASKWHIKDVVRFSGLLTYRYWTYRRNIMQTFYSGG